MQKYSERREMPARPALVPRGNAEAYTVENRGKKKESMEKTGGEDQGRGTSTVEKRLWLPR